MGVGKDGGWYDEGTAVGLYVGTDVGNAVGAMVGEYVGNGVGNVVGATLGIRVGAFEGERVGVPTVVTATTHSVPVTTRLSSTLDPSSCPK